VWAAVSGRDPNSREPNSAALVGSLLFVGGIAWLVVTRMRIWWHHG
jgi:hypothetical protein